MLADDFFALAHHDVTGRPRLNTRVLSLGLAGALLGELIGAGLLGVRDDLLVLASRSWPEQRLLQSVLAEVRHEKRVQPVRVWFAYFAKDSYAEVGHELARAGLVEPRRRVARPTRFVPIDMNRAGAPAAVLSHKLRHDVPLTAPDALLGGLVLATGLELSLFGGAPPEVFDRLRDWTRCLPRPLLRLLELLQASVGDAVLSHRT